VPGPLLQKRVLQDFEIIEISAKIKIGNDIAKGAAF